MLAPIQMYPAYRYGEQTPWGGDGLKSFFGKDIPDTRTGEALEISAIPNLESKNEKGETLSFLIEKYGEDLLGKHVNTPFPLLLKLLCAKEPLSVQVHPDDTYAKQHENKLGKTEAWVILNAEEDAFILYGLKPEVTKSMLESALYSGEDIEGMIARVSAKAGQVFYMPAGMVHAIGSGIILYEIQQSSDVTYRLWDYNRKNAENKTRELHIKQSLDVIDFSLTQHVTQMPTLLDDTCNTLLAVDNFTLQAFCVKNSVNIIKPNDTFAFLTALNPLCLQWENETLELKSGQSVFLPANGFALTLKGEGQALLSYC